MKFKFDEKSKEKFFKLFDKFKKAFKENEYVLTLLGKIPNTHFIFLQRLFFIKNVKELSNDRILMLLGAFDFVFTAGDYGYTREQNLAINDMNDFIFDLKH